MRLTRSTLGRNRRTRSAKVIGLCAVATLVAGCQPPAAPPPEPISTRPLVVDEAMDRRDWEQVAIYYPNGDTVAGTTRFWAYRVRDDVRPYWQQILFDPFLFLAQTAYLPFTFIQEPLLAKRVTQGEIFEPTHFGVPPVPAEEPAPAPAPVVTAPLVDDSETVSQPFDDRSRVRQAEPADVPETSNSAADEMPSGAKSPDAVPETPSQPADDSTTPAESAPANSPADGGRQ